MTREEFKAPRLKVVLEHDDQSFLSIRVINGYKGELVTWTGYCPSLVRRRDRLDEDETETSNKDGSE